MDSNDTDMDKFANAFTQVKALSPDIGKTYPIMITFLGTGLVGAFTGTFNATNAGFRFLVSDETHVFFGNFQKSNNAIINLNDLNSKPAYSGSLTYVPPNETRNLSLPTGADAVLLMVKNTYYGDFQLFVVCKHTATSTLEIIPIANHNTRYTVTATGYNITIAAGAYDGNAGMTVIG